MELRQALDQIAEIRLQMARSQTLRGYRSVTAAISGVLALAAAGLQSLLISNPARHVYAYIALWLGVAGVCMAVVGVEMFLRLRRSRCQVQSQLTLLAIQQFIPSVVAGGLLTFILAACAGTNVWMLPGLWMLLFGLGIFACSRVLPRETWFVAAFYLGMGLVALAMGPRVAFLPWLMGGPFAFGQFLTAGILYFSLERSHAYTSE